MEGCERYNWNLGFQYGILQQNIIEGVVGSPGESMCLYPSSVLEMRLYFCELSKVNWRASFSIRTPGLFQSNERFLNDVNIAPDFL